MRRRFQGVIYKNADGDWTWRIIARNGEKVDPPEGHKNLGDCKNIFRQLHPFLRVKVLTDDAED